jgi:hypothetical protein
VTSALVGVHTPWQENPLLHPWIVRGFDGVLFAGHSQQFCWSPPSKFLAITLFGNLMYVFDVSPPDTSSLLDPCANHLHYDCHGKVSYRSTFHYNLTSPPPQPFPRHSKVRLVWERGRIGWLHANFRNGMAPYWCLVGGIEWLHSCVATVLWGLLVSQSTPFLLPWRLFFACTKEIELQFVLVGCRIHWIRVQYNRTRWLLNRSPPAKFEARESKFDAKDKEISYIILKRSQSWTLINL